MNYWGHPSPARGAVLNSSSYNAAHHRFTVLVACLAFLLVVAGGLVTSNNAGLAVPDWPTSFGSWYKIPRMVGGVKFEHGHRMAAEFIGLLTIIVAIWTWRANELRSNDLTTPARTFEKRARLVTA